MKNIMKYLAIVTLCFAVIFSLVNPVSAATQKPGTEIKLGNYELKGGVLNSKYFYSQSCKATSSKSMTLTVYNYGSAWWKVQEYGANGWRDLNKYYTNIGTEYKRKTIKPIKGNKYRVVVGVSPRLSATGNVTCK